MPEWYNTDAGAPNPTLKDKAYTVDESAPVELTSMDDNTTRMISGDLASIPESAKAPVVTKELNAAVKEQKQALVLPDGHGADKIVKANGYKVEGNKVDLTVKTVEMPLYKSPIAGGLAIYEALDQGMSEQDIKASLLSRGYTEDDYKDFKLQAEKVASGVAAGLSTEYIAEQFSAQTPAITAHSEKLAAPALNYWTESEPNTHLRRRGPKVRSTKSFTESLSDSLMPEQTLPSARHERNPETKREAYRALVEGSDMDTGDLLKHLQVLNPSMASISTRTSGFFGNRADQQVAEEAAKASAQKIINIAKNKFGQDWVYDPKSGSFLAQTPEGLKPLDTSFWDDIKASGGEAIGATAGGIAGFKVGMELPIPHPIAKAVAVAASSISGAALGAQTGTDIDYLQSAVALNEEMNARVLAQKEFTAAEMSIIGDTVLLGAGKLGKGALRSMVKAKNYLTAGNPTGAAKALEESLFITPQEADELVAKLQRVSEVPGRLPEEKKIAAVALTSPGKQQLAQHAGVHDAKSSMAISKSIDLRAKDVLATAADLTTERAPRVLKEDFANYTYDVKNFYRSVKDQAATAPGNANFRFDYDGLVLEPALEKIEANLVPGPMLEKFSFQAQKIRNMSESRTFADLLDMRQFVNEFMFSKKVKSAKGYTELLEAKNRIDTAIKEGAKVVMPDAKQWLKDYSLANAKYAEMKKLEKNVIVKAITKPGNTPEAIAKVLTKHSTAIDDTFDSALQQLPKKMRADTEGQVINELTDKYTAGVADGPRAVNFPLLADRLSKITFTTPETRKFKAAITELADVFKNDVELARVTGDISIATFQSFLTTNPVTRAQFAFASSVFNHIRRFAPTEAGRRTALVLKTAEVLDKPLNSKAIRELMQEAGDRVNITKEVNDLANAAAKQQAKQAKSANVIFYGDGPVLGLKGTGTKQTIPVHRIATHNIVETVAEAEGINLSNKKALDIALKARGYSVVQLGTNKVRKLK